MAKLSTINGIEAAFVQQLAASGIETSDQLLRDGATPEARSAVTNASGVDPVQLLVWVCRIDLERIKGVAWDYARLLTGSGVTTVPDLATRTAEKLHSQIGATNRAHKLVRRPPTLVQVRDWIDQARELAAIVTLEAGEDERVVGYGVDGSSATLLATSTTTVVTTMVLATDDEPDATASDVLLATSDQGEAVTQEQRSLVRLATLKGMDATVAERLRVVGVETPWELLRRGARWQDRATLLREADLTETQVLYWLYQADLERVDGVAWEYAGLLAGAGVTTVPDLAQRDPQQLHLVLLRANAEHGFVQRPPTTAQLHSWVRHAGTLPALITFGAADADEALIPPGLCRRSHGRNQRRRAER
jgi:predicted flap endonuclease-1-like 5' DNA nuclease